MAYHINMKYIFKGPSKICGKIKASGAKNFSIKALAASLLTRGKSYYYNVPDNLDVHKTLGMLSSIGAVVEFDQIEKKCFVDSSNITNELMDPTNANMVTFLLGAALIHEFEFVKFPKHKGCPLGQRLVDFYIMTFEKFGISYEDSQTFYSLKRNKKPNVSNIEIVMPYPSVGATEAAIFLAVLSHGITTIRNAAIEPEIQALITMLITMGARIYYESDRVLKIHGVKQLNPVNAYIHGDLLEVGTWAVMAAALDGEIEVSGVVPELMGSFLGVYSMLGGSVERVDMHTLKFFKNHNVECKNVFFETGVFPALRTDLQPILAVQAAMNAKRTVIHETVYNDRLDYIDFFADFGINAIGFVQCLGNDCRFKEKSLHSVIIDGVRSIKSPEKILYAKTVRSGMAQMILAAGAPGDIVISNVAAVERGYCNLFSKLRSVGIDLIAVLE